MWTLEILLLLVLLLLLHRTGCTAHPGTAGSWSAPSAEGHHTNIIFIMADDIGYGDVRYNGGNADTPNLDAMARGPHSIQLTRYYAGSPVCTPTRGTVLTGRNHNRYCIKGIIDVCGQWNIDNPVCQCGRNSLPTSEITVSEILKENGYHTAVFGKWHLSILNNDTKFHFNSRDCQVVHPGMYGFNEWWVTSAGVVSTVNPNCNCFENSECDFGHWKPTDNILGLSKGDRTFKSCSKFYTLDPDSVGLKTYPEPIEGDDSNFMVDLFETFLDDVVESGQPFFVYLPFHAVHVMYVATEENREWYLSQGYNPDQADYYGAITAMDGAVGRIRQLLQQYNISNNTMLWFTSDNGPEHDTPGSTAGLKGGKHNLYEGGIRVPGIIEWPAEITGNSVSDFPVVSSDLLPTVCDILGIDPPQDRPIDGTTLLPLIRGEVHRNKSIGWEFKGMAALSGDQYKLVIEYKSGMEHLYDLVNDPFEQKDISAEYPALFGAMKVELVEWQQSVAIDSQQCREDLV